MKRIGLTQRVDVVASYGERRDALDQQWNDLLLKMNMLPIPLPNLSKERVPNLLRALDLDGIILTGGNSLSYLDDTALDSAPERDEFEKAIIECSIEYDIPLLGVCRGMQMLNHYFGGDLIKVDGHIGKEHEISSLCVSVPLPEKVNSFHRWTISESGLAKSLVPIARDSEGNIEAFTHERLSILGIMWHPERVSGFNLLDLNLIKKYLS